MPKIRAFERFISAWKIENAEVYEKTRDPDGWKNKRMVAHGRADADVFRLNQIWQIDASPADIMCVDGRYSIYAIIDVWSRRALFHVSRTACTEASLLLLRKAIMEWGVPEELKTDNGSDFVSHRFKTALETLGIEHTVCPPFSPEKKPFVERVIRTMQHDLMEILPGYLGHSVTDRKKIEGRKAFSQRLGENDDKTFSVSLSHDQLQDYMDAWCRDKYAHKVHSTLRMSPFARAASWIEPIRRIDNERGLDILLAPLAGSDGFRTIGKKGIRINNCDFAGPGLELHIGARVMVRHDPDDMGRIYVFNEDHEFICEALNYDMLGADRKQAAIAAKREQKKVYAERAKETKRLMRGIKPEDMAEKILAVHAQNSATLTQFPVPAEAYTTAALDEAARPFEKPVQHPQSAAELAAHAKFVKNFKAPPRPSEDEDRKKWEARVKACEALEEKGSVLNADDAAWMANIRHTAWYKAHKNFEAMKKDFESPK